MRPNGKTTYKRYEDNYGQNKHHHHVFAPLFWLAPAGLTLIRVALCVIRKAASAEYADSSVHIGTQGSKRGPETLTTVRQPALIRSAVHSVGVRERDGGQIREWQR